MLVRHRLEELRLPYGSERSDHALYKWSANTYTVTVRCLEPEPMTVTYDTLMVNTCSFKDRVYLSGLVYCGTGGGRLNPTRVGSLRMYLYAHGLPIRIR